MWARAVRRRRRHRNMLSRRCKKCRSDTRTHCSVLQESPVQLRIFEFAKMTVEQRSHSRRLSNCVKMTCARTLSRMVWQQKNFRAHSAQVSSTRAKPNFFGRIAIGDSEVRLPSRRYGFGSREPIDASTHAAKATSLTSQRVPLRDDLRCRASPSGDR